jgi:hypothetical protein
MASHATRQPFPLPSRLFFQRLNPFSAKNSRKPEKKLRQIKNIPYFCTP